MTLTRFYEIFFNLPTRFLFAGPIKGTKIHQQIQNRFIFLIRVWVDLILIAIGFHLVYRGFFGKNFFSVKQSRILLHSLDLHRNAFFISSLTIALILFGMSECIHRLHKDRRTQLLTVGGLFALLVRLGAQSSGIHFSLLVFQLTLSVCTLGSLTAWVFGLPQAILGIAVISGIQVFVPLLASYGLNSLRQTPATPLLAAVAPSSRKILSLKSTDEIRSYLKDCEERSHQINRHNFSIPGILELHRNAIGIDFFLRLANSCLSIPILTLRKAADFLDQLGIPWPKQTMNQIPNGLRTHVQIALEQKIADEVFQLKDLQIVENKKKLIQKQIHSFSSHRITVSDVTSSMVNIWITVKWVGKAGLSPMEMGKVLATGYAKKKAVSKFFLGKTFGGLYYGMFPPAPTRQEIWGGVFSILALLTVATLVSGLCCDLIQGLLGVHAKKMKQLFSAIEADLILDNVVQLNANPTDSRLPQTSQRA